MIPIRTCVGCGVRSPQRELVRFVAVDTALRLDGARRGSGRGAYLHPRGSCLATFRRSKRPIRSLRRTVAAGAREWLADQLAGRIVDPR